MSGLFNRVATCFAIVQCGCCCLGGLALAYSMVAVFKDSSACTCARLPVQAMVHRLVSLQIFHVFASDVFCKALMASETVGSERQMASSNAAVFCNGLGRKQGAGSPSGLLGQR